VIARVLIILAAIQASLFAYYLNATLILQPYWDMYGYVLHYLRYREHGQWLWFVWAPHNQNRPVWTRMLTQLDAGLLAGTGYPFVIAATMCLLVSVWLLLREVPAGWPRETRIAIGGLVVMLMLTAASAVDCSMPNNTLYPQALMFALLAIALFEQGGVWRGLSLIAAAGAAFGSGAALVIWPILVWLAWRSDAGPRWMMIVILFGALFIAVYAYGLPRIEPVEPSWKMGLYLLSYLGLPWSRAASLQTPARLVGAAWFVCGSVALIWLGAMKRSVTRLERVAAALIAFSLASAVLAAIGRVDVDETIRVPIRYALFIAPLHIAALFLIGPYVQRAVLMIVACLLIVQQIVSGQAAVATARSMRDTIHRFVNGDTTPEMTRVIYSDLHQAREDLDQIRRAGLYLDAR
jgi:hypothetical protein